MLQVHLKVVGGRQDGKSLPLPIGRFLVGREEDCNLRPKSELVSRHHCVFSVDEFTARLRDLGSTNGTFVNGERILGQIVLNQGDEVRIGKLEFVVQTREVEAVVPDEVDAAILDETATNTNETLMDVPVPTGLGEDFAEDQTMIDGAPPVQAPEPVLFQPPMPQYPGQPVAGQPMPPGYPPGYAYPPQQYPGYPPQMPYPGQPMYYPPQGYPQGQPGQPGAPPMEPPYTDPPTETNSSGNTETVGPPPIKLPDPSTTGAKMPEPKPEEGTGEQAAGGDENPSNRAENIIRDYMKRDTKDE